MTGSTYRAKSLPTLAEDSSGRDRGAGGNPRAPSIPHRCPVRHEVPFRFRLVRVRERSGVAVEPVDTDPRAELRPAPGISCRAGPCARTPPQPHWHSYGGTLPSPPIPPFPANVHFHHRKQSILTRPESITYLSVRAEIHLPACYCEIGEANTNPKPGTVPDRATNDRAPHRIQSPQPRCVDHGPAIPHENSR